VSNYRFKITYKPLSEIRVNPKNARTHSKIQIKDIRRSLLKYGFISPIIIDAKGEIVAGNGKYLAAASLDFSEVPTLQIDHLTPAQRRAYAIADNRLAEKAGWDKGILAEEFSFLLDDNDIDVTDTGFSLPEIDVILGEAVGISEESAPPSPLADRPSITTLGDSWQLGKHRVFCGSATESEAYEELLKGEVVDSVFTDPPYNVRIDGHVSGNGETQHREFAMASGEMSQGEFFTFLKNTCSLLTRHSRNGALHYLCMDWRHAFDLLAAGKGAYSELKNICVWTKNNGGMGSFYRSQHELIFVFKCGSAAHVNNIQLGKYGRNRTNVWDYPNAASFSKVSEEGNLAALHPTVKPLALVADAILDSTHRKDIVLDPFLGSGTTLMACHQTGRIFRGIELDPLYVDLAISRWQKRTGENAIHVRTGATFNALAAAKESSHV
jgi:DNA modification methylase